MAHKNLIDWYCLPWQQYANCRGRASRSEFWIFTLVNTAVLALLTDLLIQYAVNGHAALYELAHVPIEVAPPQPALYLIFMLVTAVPLVTVTIRRLHDINRSGWYALLYAIPVVGTVILWGMATVKSQKRSTPFK